MKPVLLRALGAAVLIVALGAVPGGATSLPSRTLVVSTGPNGELANGASAHPVLSDSGRVLAFDSTASNLLDGDVNGATRDVFAFDQLTNERRLVSQGPDGSGGDGPSSDPAIDGDGQIVAFVSTADNLVPGDTNGQADVFVRHGRDPVVRVSTAADGTQADGPSYQVDISANGRYVVFTSYADNLVPGDTNGQPDVFVRDLATGRIARVSVSATGAQAAGRSSSPAISSDGSTVSFESAAANLVPKDTNGIADVFVRDLVKGTLERVSVSTSGRQQNKSAAPPFTQISDVSQNGRFVVFDSDATDLYGQDTNQHTDVFLRDRKEKTTTLISASSVNVEGNNDSFAPRITANGRFVSFQSFATNLAVGDGPREDIFLRDLRQGTTSVVNVTADGSPRLGELVPQLLQRPAVSNDGTFAAFSSTAPNLVPGDTNGAEDVFVRQLDPPVGRLVSKPKRGHSGTIKVTADDPLATTFVCQVDTKTPFMCSKNIKLPPNAGRVLHVRAGGPGMLFDPDPVDITLNSDRKKPLVHIRRPTGHSVRVLRGTASDASGIDHVQIAFLYLDAKGCHSLVPGRKFKKTSCFARNSVRATGGRNWRVRLPKAVRGPMAIYAQAYDKAGNPSKLAVLKLVLL